MADLKISALTASTTPLAGTEVLPIVQSNTTKQVSVANLTAGRAVNVASLTASGNVQADTINFGTSYGQFTWDTGVAILQTYSGKDFVVRTQGSSTNRFTVGASDVTASGKIQTASGTFLNTSASVTCTALNTYYTVQQYYFGLYVFRDGTSGGTALVLYDSTGATIVSSTITGLAVQVLSFSTLQVRVTSGSAPRTLYWACVAAVSS